MRAVIVIEFETDLDEERSGNFWYARMERLRETVQGSYDEGLPAILHLAIKEKADEVMRVFEGWERVARLDLSRKELGNGG